MHRALKKILHRRFLHNTTSIHDRQSVRVLGDEPHIVRDHQDGHARVALELVVQVGARGEELDARVAEHARNWRVVRMARVDRNILRLASYELLHTDTPAAVILDEAVELARRYGSDTSPAFGTA